MSIKTNNDEFTQEELNIIKTIKFKDAIDESISSENEEIIKRYLKTKADIQKIVSPILDIQKQMISYNTKIASQINMSVSKIQPVMSNINKAVVSITKPIVSYINCLNEILKDFDFDEFHLRLISELLSEEQGHYEKFLEKGLFPPVFYICLEEGLNYKDINVKEYLKRKNLKKYYSDRISSWNNYDIEGYPNELIDDIKFNYDNNRVYSVVTLIFVLLEYRVRSIKISKQVPKENGQITKTIRNNLKENVFNPTNAQFLYDKFIDTKGDSYIYKNTNKEPNTITRHVLHGDKLELITYESMMSVVFLYDFINEVLSYKKL